MQVIDRGGYSREEILEVLHSKDKARNVRFRYDLLDKNEYFKQELDSVVSGEVSMSAFSTIKRTAKFVLKEEMLPERFEDFTDTDSKLFNSVATWNEGTKTGTVNDNNSLRITTGAQTVAPHYNFSTGATGSGLNAGLSEGWSHWNGSFGTYAQSGSGGFFSWGQQMTRTASGTFGIQTDNKALITLQTGNIAYLSFLFKPSGSAFSNPTYCYFMSSTAGVSNIPITNYTVTDIGNGWFRYDGSYTHTIATTTNVGVLIGWSSASTGGNVWVDNIYFQENVAPVWSAEWLSPVYDIADGEIGAVTESVVSWSARQNYGSTAKVYTRYSTTNGSTWTSWAQQSTSGAGISGLQVGTSINTSLRLQIKVVLERFEIATDAVFIDSLSFTFGRSYSVYVPETTEVNYSSDRIQPHMEIRMKDGFWISFPLGVFLLSSPTRTDGVNGSVYREIEAYDGLIILDDDKFTSRYRVTAGTKYTTGVANILASAGITKYTIEDSSKVLSNDIEFKTGMSKLEAVNELLKALNYTPLWVDANGYFVAYPYISPADRATDYVYEDNELSVTYNGMEEELDIYSIPNIWVVTESNPEKTPLYSKLTNSNPDSPTSTVSIGRNIVDFREIDEIADQATLNAYVQRIAFEASQVFGKLKFETALMPFHEYSDVLRVRYAPLKIDHTFSETSWTMPLEVGARMKHEARRVVSI